MKLTRLVEVSDTVAATRSRLKKTAALAGCLRAAKGGEIGLAVSYLTGSLPQGRIGLGPAVLRDAAGREAAETPRLALRDVDSAFERIASITGAGSQAARREALAELLGQATRPERDFLRRLVLGELRQGALEGLLVEAIAEAADVPVDAVRRAVMLAPDPAVVATAALAEGRAGLARFRLEVLSPVKPMLAQPSEGVDEALEALGEAVLDYKLDGARIQAHRDGDEVRLYSRGMNDVTERLPEVVERVLALPARRLILDGEVIALREGGRPQPFQVTMRRFGRTSEVERMRAELPLDAFFFDALLIDEDEWLDRPLAARADALEAVADSRLRVPRLVTADPGEAEAFLRRAFAKGHEGVMAKAPGSPYMAGNRGADWLKIKQAHTLDLVVLAAEWGSGRREGWLSNLHLGARGPDGGFVMLGKTFKGLTDRLLRWQTKRLQEIELGREGNVVHVRPELVVEIAVNDIQASPHYPAGLALRFARVKRYRKDKAAADADTIDTVRALHRRQTGAPP